MKKILIIALAILTYTVTAIAASTVQEADSAYARRDYSAALNGYRKALETQGSSSDLYYNLANTYYRLGNVGQAVLFYERALKLNAANDDASANLEFVRGRIKGLPEDDTTFLGKMHQNVKSALPANVWAWTAFAFFVLTLGALALYLFTDRVLVRKIGFFSAIILLAMFSYILAVAWQTANAVEDNSYAVVTSPVTNLRSEPSSSATGKSVPLPAGSRVEIVDSLTTSKDANVPMWYEVKINNNSRAWMPAADAERI